MNRLQLLGIAVAILSGGAAFFFVNQLDTGPAQIIQIAPKVETDRVLVAKTDLPYGLALTDADTEWVEWPKNAVPPGAIIKSASPNAQEEIRTAHVISPFAQGAPVRMTQILKGSSAGVMASMLPAGKRAVAVDVAVNNTAGGFILPNDRVDVMRVFRDNDASREAGAESFSTEMVLPNMRVLAIGQTVERKNNEAVVIGSTATLEVDPRQAEELAIAQRTGQLILVLRSIHDANSAPGPIQPPRKRSDDDTLTIVKNGVPTNLKLR